MLVLVGDIVGAQALAAIPAFQPGVVLPDMDLPDSADEVVLRRLLQGRAVFAARR